MLVFLEFGSYSRASLFRGLSLFIKVYHFMTYLLQVSGTIPNSWIDRLVNKVGKSGSFDKVDDFVKDLSAEGFSITRIISQVHDTVVGSDKMTDHQKSAICEKLAVSEARLLDGASEYLQMLDIISFIMNQLSKS